MILQGTLAVQWLGLSALTAQGPGLIPGRGTKIPQVGKCGQKKKKDTAHLQIQFLSFFSFFSLSLSPSLSPSLPLSLSLPSFLPIYLSIYPVLCGTWDLSSPTRDQTCAPCIGSAES